MYAIRSYYEPGPARGRPPPPEPSPMQQLLLDLLPENPPSLANFVPGTNAEALAALANWLAPECPEHSLLLWGETGRNNFL